MRCNGTIVDRCLLPETWPWWRRWPAWWVWRTPLKYAARLFWFNPFCKVVAIVRVGPVVNRNEAEFESQRSNDEATQR